MSDFGASVRDAGAAAVIDLRGDISGQADAAMADAYAAAARAGKPILLNFAGVEYINSTGIAVIVKLLASARREGRAVAATGLSAHYREIFQITRLSDFMRIYDDEAAALAARA